MEKLTKPNIRFESQHDDEETIMALRSHPITQVFWVINAFIILLILFFVNMLLPMIFNVNQIIFINLFGLVFVFFYSWYNFLNWYFNVGIITNQRVIDVDYYYILYKEITVADLAKIQDITVKTGGFLGSLLNYGNIFIQTAGTDPNIEFINISKPNRVREIIDGLTK